MQCSAHFVRLGGPSDRGGFEKGARWPRQRHPFVGPGACLCGQCLDSSTYPFHFLGPPARGCRTWVPHQGHLSDRFIARRIGGANPQRRNFSILQSNPTVVCWRPVNRKAVGRQPMQPMHLVSLGLPNWVKRMRIHVFVHPKVQFCPRGRISECKVAVAPGGLGLQSPQSTYVGRTVEQVVPLHGKPNLRGDPQRVSCCPCPDANGLGRFQPQRGKHRGPGIYFGHPTVQWIQRVLVRRVADFKMQMWTSTAP